MLRDLVIVGAGPVGATLALALREADLDVDVTRVDATPAFAEVRAKRRGEDVEWTTRLAAVADGGGDVVSSLRRRRHDYRQVALVAKVWMRHAHRGVAFERFTPEGPMAL